jgi:hypothetical protein
MLIFIKICRRSIFFRKVQNGRSIQDVEMAGKIKMAVVMQLFCSISVDSQSFLENNTCLSI